MVIETKTVNDKINRKVDMIIYVERSADDV